MRNKKGQEAGKIIEGFVAILFLIICIPIFVQLFSMMNPEPETIIDNTAIEQAKNLSAQLEICQKNYEELNKTIITKQDLSDLALAIQQTNQNVISIYETNYNYIKNYFSLTIMLSITLTIVFSIGLLTLIDLTIFKMAFIKSFINIIKQRFIRTPIEAKA